MGDSECMGQDGLKASPLWGRNWPLWGAGSRLHPHSDGEVQPPMFRGYVHSRQYITQKVV